MIDEMEGLAVVSATIYHDDSSVPIGGGNMRNGLENLSTQIDKNASIYSRKCILCNLGVISMGLGAIMYLVPFFL